MFNVFSSIQKSATYSAKKRLLIATTLAVISTSAHSGWEVQWIDTFDGSGVDWSNWTAQTQANYNNEVQCYTADDSSADKNYDVSNGTLKIIARKQFNFCPTLGGAAKAWTSGRLNSKDKREFLYGRIESRIRFHNLERGTWPAFWMLENRISEQPIKGDGDNVNWPNIGASEIDVWEWFSNEPETYITNFFNTSSNCGSEYRYRYPNGAQDVLDWHRYAIEWTEDKIEFFIDDKLVVAQDMRNCSRYQEPMFALLNVAMGGNLGGAIDPALEKATMEVDYIAHCQRSDDSDSMFCDESALRVDEPPKEDLLPSLYIQLKQSSGHVTNSITSDGGEAVISTFTNLSSDLSSDYTLKWEAEQLPSPVMQGSDLRFDPSSMLGGNYSVTASLVNNSDDSLTVSNSITFRVTSSEKQDSGLNSPSDSSGGSIGLAMLFGIFSFGLFRKYS